MTQEKLSLFFENLHPSTSVDAFRDIYAEDVVFKDPFNEVKGVEAVYEVFAHMYENLDNPRFVITEYIDTQDITYVKWDFMFTFKGEKKEQCFEGVSRLALNESDRVSLHTDYWDAAEHIYEKMPVVGSLLRFVKRKIAGS
jgi:hypothetical protein